MSRDVIVGVFYTIILVSQHMFKVLIDSRIWIIRTSEKYRIIQDFELDSYPREILIDAYRRSNGIAQINNATGAARQRYSREPTDA